jgi:cellulose biosynthesis protein BcsQ
MIYAVVNNKGGAGKSTIAFNCLTAILDNFRLVEIDNNNITSASFTKSEKLNGKVKSVKISQGFEAFDEALFEMMQDKTCDIIIDAGGGDDSIAVIKLLLRESDHNELVFIIPLMTGSGQVNNALDTYELVKDHKVVFVLNASAAKE